MANARQCRVNPYVIAHNQHTGIGYCGSKIARAINEIARAGGWCACGEAGNGGIIHELADDNVRHRRLSQALRYSFVITNSR
jgi:hypothetical protein